MSIKKKAILIGGLIILIIIFLCIIEEDSVKVIDQGSSDSLYVINKGEVINSIKIIYINKICIIVKHEGNIKLCTYGKLYEFWPDSKNGTMLWHNPRARLIFEKT